MIVMEVLSRKQMKDLASVTIRGECHWEFLKCWGFSSDAHDYAEYATAQAAGQLGQGMRWWLEMQVPEVA